MLSILASFVSLLAYAFSQTVFREMEVSLFLNLSPFAAFLVIYLANGDVHANLLKRFVGVFREAKLYIHLFLVLGMLIILGFSNEAPFSSYTSTHVLLSLVAFLVPAGYYLSSAFIFKAANKTRLSDLEDYEVFLLSISLINAMGSILEILAIGAFLIFVGHDFIGLPGDDLILLGFFGGSSAIFLASLWLLLGMWLSTRMSLEVTIFYTFTPVFTFFISNFLFSKGFPVGSVEGVYLKYAIFAAVVVFAYGIFKNINKKKNKGVS